jgi:hypothetical protein
MRLPRRCRGSTPPQPWSVARVHVRVRAPGPAEREVLGRDARAVGQQAARLREYVPPPACPSVKQCIRTYFLSPIGARNASESKTISDARRREQCACIASRIAASKSLQISKSCGVVLQIIMSCACIVSGSHRAPRAPLPSAASVHRGRRSRARLEVHLDASDPCVRCAGHFPPETRCARYHSSQGGSGRLPSV